MGSTERKYGKFVVPDTGEATYTGASLHVPAGAYAAAHAYDTLKDARRRLLFCAVTLVVLAMVRATRRHLPTVLLVVVMCAALRYTIPWMAVVAGVAVARLWVATMGGQQFSTLGLAIGIVLASVL